MAENNSNNKKTDNIFSRFLHKLDRIPIGVGKEREYFVENVGMLVASGMPILLAIDSVREEMRSRAMKNIISDLRDDIEKGLPLWKALNNSGLFRDHTISLVRIGEESGKLSDNLKMIARQEEKDRLFRSKIRTAMMYPVLVLGVTVLVGTGVAWFILPRLSTVFDSLNIPLPLVTKILIGAGKFLAVYGNIALPIFFIFLFSFFYLLFFYSKTKFIGQSILFAFPGVKNLLQEIELARFGYLLGTLLHSGLPATQALDSLYKATIFPAYKKFYAFLRDRIEEGNSFSRSFELYKGYGKKLIPIPIQQLVSVGERSGSLSDTLIRISESYEARIDNTTKNLTVILEPILLVIVWVGVLSVALAVILPIYSLIGGLSEQTNPSQVEKKPEVVTIPAPIEGEVVSEEMSGTLGSEIEERETGLLEIITNGITYLNIRSEPSAGAEAVGRALPGEQFEFLTFDDGWYEIILPNNNNSSGQLATGWVSADFVEIVE